MSVDDQTKVQSLSDQYLMERVLDVVRESLLLAGGRRALLARLVRELGGGPATEEYLAADGVTLSVEDRALLSSVSGQVVFPDEAEIERLVFLGGEARYVDFVTDIESFLFDEGEDYPRIVHDPVKKQTYAATVEVVLRKLEPSSGKVGFCPGCGEEFALPGCPCGWRE